MKTHRSKTKAEPLAKGSKSPGIAGAAQKHRPSFERMLWIHNEMQAGRYPNAARLEEKFGYKRKTMLRDTEFMADRLHLPLAYDRVQHGYYYTKPVDRFPTVQITERELVALCIAQRSLECYRGTPFERDLSEAFKKLTENLADTVTYNFGALASAVSFSNAGFEVTLNLELFELLSAAIMGRQQVTFEYAKLTGSGYEARRINPLHLLNVAGVWYLFAYDVVREAIRRFALVRMRRARRTTKVFERPTDFNLEAELKESMGVFGGKPEQVKLRFRGIAARLMLEHRWHASQRTERMGENEVEVTLQVAITPELEGWILRWSPRVEVLAPTALRGAIREKALEAAERNGSPA